MAARRQRIHLAETTNATLEIPILDVDGFVPYDFWAEMRSSLTARRGDLFRATASWSDTTMTQLYRDVLALNGRRTHCGTARGAVRRIPAHGWRVLVR